MLVDILEPHQQREDKTDVIFGIDFGTTNSLIAYSTPAETIIIPGEGGHKVLKSSFVYNGKFINSIKRLFGKSYDEASEFYANSTFKNLLCKAEGGLVALNIDGEKILPIEVGAEIFKMLKLRASSYLNIEPKKAVVTVPAYFDDSAKAEVRSAAELAGIEVVRLIAEPTAAAYAYSLEKIEEGNYLVYDFGGGTFDVSVLKMHMGAFQVLSVSGDNNLGGDDIDMLISSHVKDKYDLDIKEQETEEFLEFCVSLKQEYSSGKREFFWKEKKICNLDLESVILPLIERTISLARKAYKDSKLKSLSGILLAGGSSRIPLIKTLLSNAFENVQFIDTINPDEVVVLGAAMQARNIAYKIGDLLIDVVPLSLGIELMGGLVERVIERNTPIPSSVIRKYTTYADNQTGFEFHIVQGDREFAEDCRSLAKFALKGIPPMPAGSAHLEVEFKIDRDGLLEVSARELVSGSVQHIEVRPTYGLSKEKVSAMIKEAIEHAEDDLLASRLGAKIIEADAAISKMKKITKEHFQLFNEQEIIQLQEKISILQDAINSGNFPVVDEKFEQFLEFSQIYIEKLMSAELTGYLSGKNVTEI